MINKERLKETFIKLVSIDSVSEVLQTIQEDDIPHAPLDVVFTVCEEIGLLGARHLNFDKISAKYGFTLDATGTNGVITRAPFANHIAFKIHGRSAHAGAKPEKGYLYGRAGNRDARYAHDPGISRSGRHG
jgi:di/tripeptidase